MTIAINASSAYVASSTQDGASARRAEHRQHRTAVGEALGNGDLDAARTAFAKLVDSSPNAADRVSKHPDGAFAKLQAALESGDVQAAQAAYQQLPGVRKGGVPDGAQTFGGVGGGSASSARAAHGALGQHLDVTA